MVSQLSHLKRTSFHILHCVGYIQEPHIRRFGLVFELGNSHGMEEPPVGLCDLYSSMRRVPLGLRMRLANALAVALGNFHRVGWVHKEVKSENIWFLKKDKQEMESMEGMGVDFAQPWLFGFECSRPEDIESELKGDFSEKNNAHRHPERWGQPMVKFERYHDVYSLVRITLAAPFSAELIGVVKGVICYELAVWKLATQWEAMKPKNSSRLDPWDIREKLLDSMRKGLPHRVGQNFADVIGACLRFKELTEGFDDFRIHQEFKVSILDKLERTAKIV